MADHIKVFAELKQALEAAKREHCDKLSDSFVRRTMTIEMQETLREIVTLSQQSRTHLTEIIAAAEEIAADFSCQFCLDCARVIPMIPAYRFEDCNDDEVREQLDHFARCYECRHKRDAQIVAEIEGRCECGAAHHREQIERKESE